jgi:hypothetical protein
MANPDRPTNLLWVSDKPESHEAVGALKASGLPFQVFNVDELRPTDLTSEQTPLLDNAHGSFKGIDHIVTYVKAAPALEKLLRKKNAR